MNGCSAHTDVAIVGAGFTGLAAATELRAAGIDCLLFEARDRVGGRVEAGINGLGETIDLGGQFICDDMPGILALARKHRKTLIKSYVTGNEIVSPSPHDMDGLYARVMAIRDRLNTVDPDSYAGASLSVAAWTNAQPDDRDARDGFLSMIEGLWCQPPDDVPVWYLIDNDRRITNEVSELQIFVRETIHSLAVDLARSLGEAVRLCEPAARIEHGPAGIIVHTKLGRTTCRNLIIAVPPVMAGRIAFDPPLPAPLTEALGAWRSGSVIKALIRYSKPFWRHRGLSGTVFFLDPHGLYACDASHDDDHAALVAFVGGNLASLWGASGEQGIRQNILARLREALGPDAADPLDITLRNWSDDAWSGGAYSDIIIDPNARNAEAILREGLSGIAFASSELSPSFPGYIEGALVAGRAAATRVIESLGAPPPR